MPSIDIFHDDAFSLSSLTAAINDQPHVPGRITSQGLFAEEGITTTTVQIEKDGDSLALVPAGSRGAPGQIVTGSRRSMIPFNTIHLPQAATIMADEIQGLRQFGSESELESVQTVVNKRLVKMRRQLDATIEYHRIGAIKGQILDADGKTVLLDLLQQFGLTRKSVTFDLTKPETHLRSKCLEVQEHIEDALGGLTFTGTRAYCGKKFWAGLLANDSFESTYLNSELAAALRGEPRRRSNSAASCSSATAATSAAYPTCRKTVPSPFRKGCPTCSSPASRRATTWKRSTPTVCPTTRARKS